MIRRINLTRMIFIVTCLVCMQGLPAIADEVDNLIRQSKSKNFGIAIGAVDRLSKIDEDRAFNALVYALQNHPEEGIRQHAAYVLSPADDGLGDPRAIKSLIRALQKDPDKSVRRQAIWSIDFFASAARSTDPRFLKPAVKPLIKALFHDEDEDVRTYAISALGQSIFQEIGDPAVSQAFVQALNDPAGSVREAAAEALADFKDPKTIDLFVGLLNDKDSDVRVVAARALAKLDAKQAVDAIMPLLRDSNGQVRAVASDTLKKLGVSEDVIDSAALSPEEKLDIILGKFEKSSWSSDKSNYKEAIELVRMVNPSRDIPEKAQKHLARGKAAFEIATDQSGYREALDEFQVAANLAPWWSAAHFNLGVAQEQIREYSRAKESFELYLLASPDASDAGAVKEKIYKIEYMIEQTKKAKKYVEEGHKCLNKEKYADAKFFYEEAIRIDPGCGEAYAWLGISLYRLKRPKDAIPKLQEGIRLHNYGYREETVYNFLGLAYEKTGNTTKAIQAFEDGIRKTGFGSVDECLNYNLGRLFMNTGDYERAIKHLEVALDRNHPSSENIKRWIKEARRYLGR